jgi:hypothetical protein
MYGQILGLENILGVSILLQMSQYANTIPQIPTDLSKELQQSKMICLIVPGAKIRSLTAVFPLLFNL